MSKKVEKLSKEELDNILKLQGKFNGFLLEIGTLEIRKADVEVAWRKVNEEMNEVKKELQEKYGEVNIDLKNGAISELEKENEKCN